MSSSTLATRLWQTARHLSPDFDVAYSINRLGFRDPPRQLPKRQGVYRALLYGDSFVFGWGVAEERRFSSLLEHRIPNVEMWNLGVPGYGLDQELVLYERDARSFNADEVVFCVSDVILSRDRRSYIYRKTKPRFAIDPGGNLMLIPPPLPRLTSALYTGLGWLHLPYFVDQWLSSGWLGTSHHPLARFAHGASAPALDEVSRKILETGSAMARERGARFTVLSHLDGAAAEELRQLCRRHQIDLIQLHLENERRDLILSEHDGHWSARGNAAVASQVLVHFESARRGLAGRGG